jgi:hypothetical protein
MRGRAAGKRKIGAKWSFFAPIIAITTRNTSKPNRRRVKVKRFAAAKS